MLSTRLTPFNTRRQRRSTQFNTSRQRNSTPENFGTGAIRSNHPPLPFNPPSMRYPRGENTRRRGHHQRQNHTMLTASSPCHQTHNFQRALPTKILRDEARHYLPSGFCTLDATNPDTGIGRLDNDQPTFRPRPQKRLRKRGCGSLPGMV